jgi:tRNA dimethylallyltransferase
MWRTRLTGKVLVILGPTAVGKTGLAIEIARQFNGEIVSADSRQTYREMDIGTAKPTPEQQAQAPHHLLDVVNPDENLSLAQYQRMAYETINQIHGRGHLPMLVGGTGQYITAVIEGWKVPEVPPNPTLRADLEAFAAQHGADALHQRLRDADPEAAGRIDYRNVRRVIRALEIVLETGEPMDYEQRKQPPPYDVFQIGLTMDRERLYERADRRIEEMVEQGFLDEVRRLLDTGYERRLPSMSGLGYAQLAAYLAGDYTLEEALEATRTATHDFIRRQYTWFRGHDQGIVWVDAEQIDVKPLIQTLGDWLEE